jgi:RHS repeat-associated protein
MVETKSGRFYVHANAQFSPMAISNAAGEVVERRQYGPYGEIEVNDEGVPPVELSVGYTGREWDADVGMYYFRARWYSPKMGRFVNRDELGYVDGMNLYRGYFVPGAMDPSGMIECDGCKAYVFVGNTRTTKPGKGWSLSDPFGLSKMRAYVWSIIDTSNLKQAASVLRDKYVEAGYKGVEIVDGEASTADAFRAKIKEPCVSAIAFVGHGGNADFPILTFGDGNDIVSPSDDFEKNPCLTSGFFGACNSKVTVQLGGKTIGFASALGIDLFGYETSIRSSLVLANAKSYKPPAPSPCCDAKKITDVKIPSGGGGE